MSHCQTTRNNILTPIAAALCFIIVLATQPLAQSGTSRPSPIDRRVEEINRQREQFERETLRSGLEGKPGKPTNQRQTQAIMLQIKQDLERIQSVYNEIVIATSPDKALDYKFISDATAEIKRSASRLSNNLALPEPEDDEKNPRKEGDFDDEQMKRSVLMLRGHIVSFLTNPLFESSGVLDIELATKASRDLKKILLLSESIGKGADKLKKGKH